MNVGVAVVVNVSPPCCIVVGHDHCCVKRVAVDRTSKGRYAMLPNCLCH